jgi:hypothetical protein
MSTPTYSQKDGTLEHVEDHDAKISLADYSRNVNAKYTSFGFAVFRLPLTHQNAESEIP